MTYVQYGVKLSDGQKDKLARTLSNKSAITIRLTKSDLTGSDHLMLTKTQLKRIEKAMNNGTGVDLKISKTQMSHLVQEGGSLWSSLFSLGTKALPYATKAMTKVAPALATGAVQALGSLGIDKIFGKGQSGGFLIPQNKIDQLIKHKDLLTKKQKEQIVSAVHTGGQLIVKPTKKQSGGFLGTLLASIGVPLLLNALTGKGLQVDSKRSRRSVNVHVPKVLSNKTSTSKKDGGLVLPQNWRSPPFYGNWPDQTGMGKKKRPRKTKKRERLTTREKQSIQQHPNTRFNILKTKSNIPHFINKPLSNLDLLNWVKKLGMKHFRGIYSRDGLPPKILKNEVGIINLDSQIGPGTHWVAYRNGKNRAEYFDSFGLIMPNEVMIFLMTSGKQIFYSGDEIQERFSALWILVLILFTGETKRCSYAKCHP